MEHHNPTLMTISRTCATGRDVQRLIDSVIAYDEPGVDCDLCGGEGGQHYDCCPIIAARRLVGATISTAFI